MTILEFLKLPVAKQNAVFVCSRILSSQLRCALAEALLAKDYNKASEITELLVKLPIK